MDAPPEFSGAKASADSGLLSPPSRSLPSFHQPHSANIDAGKSGAKTPISLLQEACLKRKLTPVYELISTEGQVHEPVFTYCCMVEGIKGQGSGKSKKTAKHLAALGILQEVARRGKGSDWGIPGSSVADSINYLLSLMPEKAHKTGAADEEEAPDNPVGKLQEKCSQLKLPVPEYELEEELGQPHEKSFKVVVRLGKLKARSQAKTKKAAKRVAAELMLSQISDVSSNQGFDEDDLVEVSEDEGVWEIFRVFVLRAL